MIDIKKLLESPHVTIRYCKLFRFHNMCGFGRCRHTSCKNCCHTNYYIIFGNSYNEHRLPNFIQAILRKVWN